MRSHRRYSVNSKNKNATAQGRMFDVCWEELAGAGGPGGGGVIWGVVPVLDRNYYRNGWVWQVRGRQDP